MENPIPVALELGSDRGFLLVAITPAVHTACSSGVEVLFLFFQFFTDLHDLSNRYLHQPDVDVNDGRNRGPVKPVPIPGVVAFLITVAVKKGIGQVTAVSPEWFR